MNILYLSNAVPYDGIRHAGGKTFNYYIKNMSCCADCNIRVIAYAKKKEKEYFDSDKYSISCDVIFTSGSILLNAKRVVFDLLGAAFRWPGIEGSYYKKKALMDKLLQLKMNGYTPDIIQLEWTCMVLQIEDVKKIFPHAKYIASEHDVSFLGVLRKNQVNPIKYPYDLYLSQKEAELSALTHADVVMPQNIKDKNLLIENGISADKIFVLTPYYHDMTDIRRTPSTCDVIFWGAMYREENYTAALWFIDNVMPLLDKNVHFKVIGNNPPAVLKSRESESIHITGFVKDETVFFEKSLCFVAPLVTGAGIKIKNIEALSSGIPVLTNEIGIEGIPANAGEHYFHCVTPADYAKAIDQLLKGVIDLAAMENAQRKLIQEEFSLKDAFKKYRNMLNLLID